MKTKVIPFPPAGKAPPPALPPSLDRRDPAALLPMAIESAREAFAAIPRDPQAMMDHAANAYVWLAMLLSRDGLPVPFQDGGPNYWPRGVREIHAEVEARAGAGAPEADATSAEPTPAARAWIVSPLFPTP